jgi:hypothetical protein
MLPALAKAFPPDMLAQVQESNLAVYEIDLEAAITRFIKTFCSRGDQE